MFLFSDKTMNPEIQQHIINQVKAVMPANIALADELAETLDMSHDSVYRRIRGEKFFTLEELSILSEKYNISVDAALNNRSGKVIFDTEQTDEGPFRLEKQLQFLHDQLHQLHKQSGGRLVYLAKDIPVFYYFNYPELLSFKFYAWARTLLSDVQHGNDRFATEKKVDSKIHLLAQKTLQAYVAIDSVEIWSVETIYSTIRQIEYCREAMLFENDEMPQRLYRQLLQLIDHVEVQCNTGVKFIDGLKTGEEGSLKLYYNGAILGDNTILMQWENGARVYLNHGILNFIHTTDKTFTGFTSNSLENLIRKSTLISTTGEKERNRFFNVLRKELQKYL